MPRNNDGMIGGLEEHKRTTTLGHSVLARGEVHHTQVF